MIFREPPEYLVIDGVRYPIDTDFRTWIKFFYAAQNREELEGFFEQLALPFSQSAADAVCDFFIGPIQGEKGGKQTFDFKSDEKMIYSAFEGAYKIDLMSIPHLHWWKFMALFRSLPDGSELRNAMYFRGVDVNDLPKNQRAHALKMKGVYKINSQHDRKGVSLREHVEHLKKLQEESRMSQMRGKQQSGVD